MICDHWEQILRSIPASNRVFGAICGYPNNSMPLEDAMHTSLVRLFYIGSVLWICLVMPRLAAASSPEEKATPVVLSTDVGNEIDDQWAIAYLFTNPAFDVRGVISAHAPSLPDPSAHATYLVLRDEVEHRLGLKVHAPLLEGSSHPLVDEQTPQPNAGTQFLIDTSQAFGPDHRLTVLTIGAATDVASAILEDPSIVNRIHVVAMAFSSSAVDGGREFNVENDPKAWKVLLHSTVPLTVGPGETCRKYLALNYDQARKLLYGHGPVSRWLWAEYQSWYFRNIKPLRINDFSGSWFIWDIITLADIESFATETEAPRPELGDDYSLRPQAGDKTILWITAVNSDRLWIDFTKHLDEFQQQHAVSDNDQ